MKDTYSIKIMGNPAKVNPGGKETPKKATLTLSRSPSQRARKIRAWEERSARKDCVIA